MNNVRMIQGRRIGGIGHAIVVIALALITTTAARTLAAGREQDRWVGTWAAAPQNAITPQPTVYRNQTLRLIVHVSIGGNKLRVRLSNSFGDKTLAIGAAHVARRTGAANIDPHSDRTLMFGGKKSATIPPHSMIVSDAVELDVPALSDLAVSVFLPESTAVTTAHILAQQTNYVSPPAGDATASANFPVEKTISSWPFLSGVDVVSPRGQAIVAFGSSLTDGDGSTKDTNRRWPNVLAERLQKNGKTEIAVLNEGIIGNRLLSDNKSPGQTGGPLAAAYAELGVHLGHSGLRRFDRDVLEEPGVMYVILALGVNDILFPGSFINASRTVTAEALIKGNRELIARAHARGIGAIGATIPPFEHALFRWLSFDQFYSPEKEKIRQQVNEWVRHGDAFDGVIDFDAAVRDPDHPTQILPAYDSGDHLHPNNDGNVAEANAIPLSLFRHWGRRRSDRR